MPLEFVPISLDRQGDYLDIFSRCPQKASDYSFINIWGWAQEYGLEWAWSENLVWLKQTRPREVYWAPVGAWQTIDWPAMAAKFIDSTATFIRVPEDLSRLWQADQGLRLVAAESRDHWDYLYDREELAGLKGNRFHKKKNLVNQFKKKYDFSFVPLGPDVTHQALALQDSWCAWRDCESSKTLSSENRAIEKVLKGWESLMGIIGGALMVDGDMAAYTVAEPLGPDTAVVHFEKGNPDYKGVYQAINQMFLIHADESFKTVNREQDLGDEGLRKAKHSYHPTGYLKKYQVTLSV